jgi:hypothetical protein
VFDSHQAEVALGQFRSVLRCFQFALSSVGSVQAVLRPQFL